MKTNNQISAYILRGATGVLLFLCVIVALGLAINLPEQPIKAIAPQNTALFGASRSLSFAERVAYQTAIEDVYWRHRIWPATNPAPKPSLARVMSQADIEKKVTDYLRNSQALDDYWRRPITAEQLQAEMERMASDTKQPEVLHELFEAIGNDPFVIAECLARPILAERLTGHLAVVAEPALSVSRTGVPPAPMKSFAADTAASTENRIRVTANVAYHVPVIASPSGDCDAWAPTTLINAPPGRYLVTSVWTGTEMIVWGGEASGAQLNTGGRYNPSTDSWTATSTTNAPDGRRRHSAVWTGSEMIVWGGYNGDFLNTGGRYNPSTDSWTATSTTNTPAGRSRHGAVWSGSQMIVWGGRDLGTLGFNTGGKYDPDTDSWVGPTTTTNAPPGRSNPTAIWTGSEMIVWGGQTGQATLFDTGGRYNPVIDNWVPTTTTNAPSARQDHTAVWTDSEMIVWGGYNGSYLNTGGRYDPSTDSWTATSTTNAPAGRSEHTAVWADSEIEMIVWGGRDPTALNTGGKYCAALGLSVISSDPVCGSVVSSQPTDFVINLSDPVQPPTVQATDFTVNGTPATSFTLGNGNTTITFHYTTSPVITQGEQTMHIPAGAFLSDPDGYPVIAFNCTFRYDATLLAVTNTVPPVGGTFSPPAPGTYEYDVNWNEAVEPTSVQANDLTLSGNTGASVTNVELINGNTTIRYTLNIIFGGSLTADIAAGAITDPFGNPNAAFSGSYTVKASAPSCVPPPPNMVSWWPGDGNTDDIVDGNNGTYVGNASYNAGEVGQAFGFDGSSYVEVPDAANLGFEPNAPITVDMWVYRIGSASVMHFIGKRVGCGSGGINYQMVLDGNGLGFGGDGGGVGTGQDLPLNTWTHLAGTFDGSTFRFYINGTLAGTGTGTLGPSNNASLLIGASGNCSRFVGLIDEVELFNRALSQPEISAIVNAGSFGKCKPTPTPSPTPTATATATATATPTATASSTPRPTPTPRARPTPAPRP